MSAANDISATSTWSRRGGWSRGKGRYHRSTARTLGTQSSGGRPLKESLNQLQCPMQPLTEGPRLLAALADIHANVAVGSRPPAQRACAGSSTGADSLRSPRALLVCPGDNVQPRNPLLSGCASRTAPEEHPANAALRERPALPAREDLTRVRPSQHSVFSLTLFPAYSRPPRRFRPTDAVETVADAGVGSAPVPIQRSGDS